MKKYSFIVLVLSIILVSGCTTLTEENIDIVAAQMQEIYDGIDTIQVRIEQTGFADDGSIYSESVTIKYVDKLANKRKMEFVEGYFRDAGKITNLWIGNDYYDERENLVYYYSCSTNVFDEPDFIDELRSMLSKWSSIELIGTEIIDGSEAYKIRLGEENEEHYIWIDKGRYLPIKELFTGQLEKTFSDYAVNGDIPDEIFSLPSDKEIIEKSCLSE
jgi:outer membrane lipoprotein-sorting protein